MRHLLLLALGTLAALAQTRPDAGHLAAAANLPSQPIGPNDLLSVSVYDSPELTRSVRVSPDGYIQMPLIPSRIQVMGKLSTEVEPLVAAALVSAQILVDPVVSVSVAAYQSRPIHVIGAVKNPLTFQADGPTRLLDALGRAGGFSENAGADVLIASPGALVRRIPIKELLNATDPQHNVPLTGGEEISVPAAGRVFVLGNVKRPGAFPLRDANEGSVLQMLALAEGLTMFSTKEAYIYRLKDGAQRTEIPVKLDSILKRQTPDITVLADDILYVPENKGRRLGMAALERALMFGSTAGATALIYGGRR